MSLRYCGFVGVDCIEARGKFAIFRLEMSSNSPNARARLTCMLSRVGYRPYDDCAMIGVLCVAGDGTTSGMGFPGMPVRPNDASSSGLNKSSSGDWSERSGLDPLEALA